MYDFAAKNGDKSTEETRKQGINSDSSLNLERSAKINTALFWADPLSKVGYCEGAELAHLRAMEILGEMNYVRLQPVLNNNPTNIDPNGPKTTKNKQKMEELLPGFDQCGEESFGVLAEVACNFIQENP